MNVVQSIFKRPAKAGGKEANMADNTTTPPAGGTASGGLSKEDVQAIVAEAVAERLKPVAETLTALSENQKVIADTLAKLPPAGEGAGGAKKKDAEEPKPPTADEIKKLVADGIAAAAAAQQQTAEQKAAKAAFLEQHLAKLPEAYKRQLGDDPKSWAAEATSIQKQFETDFKAGGGKTTDVGGAGRDGGTAASGQAAAASGKSFIPENTAKQAAAIVMPAA